MKYNHTQNPSLHTPDFDVTSIPQTPQKTLIRAAAYCRVSTDDPAQEYSIEGQTAHWTAYIADQQSHPDSTPWEFAGIYSESGLSGTKAETRPQLMQLIEDSKAGKIDLVLTKSISRFSRNIVDCLHLVRTLKALGVGIIFEKEHINTMTMESEFYLSILASFAEDESRSLSKNVKLGYVHRFRMGEYFYKRPPYGYFVENGDLKPDPKQSLIVEEIFEQVLVGAMLTDIAKDLNARNIPTKYNVTWVRNSILNIVTNLTYTGDCLLQKTFRDQEYNTHKNKGEQDRYYVPDHHEAIISREVFILANESLGFPNPYTRIREAEAEDLEKLQEFPQNEDLSQKKKVTVIKATPPENDQNAKPKQLRVAAYCRVSTDSDEQESSYEVQCTHYKALINANPNWSLVGIYADEGLSGTTRVHRDDFNRMIADAEAGKIDLILTKSISRFARNTLDCISVVRRLKKLGVAISFEKEGLDTLDGNGEVILTILASIAQQESASISQNVRIGIQYRFQQGIPRVNCERFLGYDKDVNGRIKPALFGS